MDQRGKWFGVRQVGAVPGGKVMLRQVAGHVALVAGRDGAVIGADDGGGGGLGDV